MSSIKSKCVLLLCRFRSCDSSAAIPERSPTPLHYPLMARDTCLEWERASTSLEVTLLCLVGTVTKRKISIFIPSRTMCITCLLSKAFILTCCVCAVVPEKNASHSAQCTPFSNAVKGLPNLRDRFVQYGIRMSFWGSGTLKIVIYVENYPQKPSFWLADYHPLWGGGC